MEERILKVLGSDWVVVGLSDYFRFALLRRVVDDEYTYVIVRLVAPTKVKLNVDGSPVQPKQWKNFFPITIKAGHDFVFMSQLFHDLCLVDGLQLPLL